MFNQTFDKKLSDGYFYFPVHISRKSGFSTLRHVKAKYRNRFNFTPEDDLRCALSTMQPEVTILSKTSHMSSH